MAVGLVLRRALGCTLGCALGCALLGVGAASAWAGSPGEADQALLLGAVPTFPTAEAARTACGPDQVVWADGYDGYYYGSGHAKYGATVTGGFACAQSAKRANYWDIAEQPGMQGHAGRSFPFTPVFVGS